MKHFYLILLCTFISVSVNATEYCPFIEEGKVWYVGRYPMGDSSQTPLSMSCYYFDGDTLVGGVSCKRWMKDGTLLAPVYEKNHKVYFFPSGEETPHVLYDFDVTAGETTEVTAFCSGMAAQQGEKVTCYIDSIKTDGHGLRHFYLYDSIGLNHLEEGGGEPDKQAREEITYTWTEGIGAWNMPECNVGWGGAIGNVSCMVRVKVGDEIIYDLPSAKWPIPTVYAGEYDYDEEENILFFEDFSVWMSCLRMEDGTWMERTFQTSKDSIIDGREYVQVICRKWPKYVFNEKPQDILLLRQEGDRIYWYDPTTREDVPLIDFSLNVGDAFTYPDGRVYTVTETGLFDEYARFGYYYNGEPFTPRMLRLQADGEEDVWIDGIGSVKWGIVPLSAVGTLDAFQGKTPDKLCLMIAPCGCFDVKEDDYKSHFFRVSDDYEDEYGYISSPVLEYAFVGDSLHITGAAPLNCGTACAKAEKNESTIDVSINQFEWGWYLPDCMFTRAVDVKIPGFKAGTYQVGLEGGEHQTLVCNPTVGIALTPAISQGEGGVYDLSGRKVNANGNANLNSLRLKKGIYIKGRKKVMVK